MNNTFKSIKDTKKKNRTYSIAKSITQSRNGFMTTHITVPQQVIHTETRVVCGGLLTVPKTGSLEGVVTTIQMKRDKLIFY